ncbi:MAG: hypothetical protein JWN40_396 [Phycisphaerales bacterium]|nr:hypothetical protein [Phycisphaerales bacterium]
MDEQIIGRWAGRSPSGELVRYDFHADQSVVWTVESADSPGDVTAKYSVNATHEPREIDIFDFDMPQLKGFRFLGIYQHEAKGVLRFYGEPRSPNNTEPRPKHFSDEAILLHCESDGGPSTG